MKTALSQETTSGRPRVRTLNPSHSTAVVSIALPVRVVFLVSFKKIDAYASSSSSESGQGIIIKRADGQGRGWPRKSQRTWDDVSPQFCRWRCEKIEG
jgi:hypothetical protein